jgi:hypothetical protein
MDSLKIYQKVKLRRFSVYREQFNFIHLTQELPNSDERTWSRLPWPLWPVYVHLHITSVAFDFALSRSVLKAAFEKVFSMWRSELLKPIPFKSKANALRQN